MLLCKTVSTGRCAGRVPNDVEKPSRRGEGVRLGSWATPDFGGYQDMARPIRRDPEPIVRWRSRGHWGSGGLFCRRRRDGEGARHVLPALEFAEDDLA